MKEILPDLKNVIFNVFQDMLFVFPDEYDNEVKFPDNWIKCRIKLYKEKTIYFSLYFTPNQARIITENYLGQNDDLPDSIIYETIKETANVVGGNFLNSFKKDYSLGIPELLDTEDKNILEKKYKEGNGILLDIEDEPFLILVS